MKLRNCPLCGDSPQLLRWHAFGGYYEVRCIGAHEGCGGSSGKWRKQDTAKRKWNEMRRTKERTKP